uniref:NADH:ubiquinone reductase (non-electrogenic) n=1 Tax=Ananas comosus var. bracteatus TaxID=296719 RepID=A0A6V7NWI0_ANACO|nr:unnamed protein product [Ananas comosus var. bracteatus]
MWSGTTPVAASSTRKARKVERHNTRVQRQQVTQRSKEKDRGHKRRCSGGIVAYAGSKFDNTAEQTQVTQKKKMMVLGTGWAGTAFLKNLDYSLYDVKVISPRNYFTFTPLLPSVTCGTVEPRSIVEPIRKIIGKKGEEIDYWEADCYKINAVGKKWERRSIP